MAASSDCTNAHKAKKHYCQRCNCGTCTKKVGVRLSAKVKIKVGFKEAFSVDLIVAKPSVSAACDYFGWVTQMQLRCLLE
jgi:hypothetical protein